MVKKESRSTRGTCCTSQPCSIRAPMIINAGIKKIITNPARQVLWPKNILAEAGIERIQINSDNRGEGS